MITIITIIIYLWIPLLYNIICLFNDGVYTRINEWFGHGQLHYNITYAECLNLHTHAVCYRTHGQYYNIHSTTLWIRLVVAEWNSSSSPYAFNWSGTVRCSRDAGRLFPTVTRRTLYIFTCYFLFGMGHAHNII